MALKAPKSKPEAGPTSPADDELGDELNEADNYRSRQSTLAGKRRPMRNSRGSQDSGSSDNSDMDSADEAAEEPAFGGSASNAKMQDGGVHQRMVRCEQPSLLYFQG